MEQHAHLVKKENIVGQTRSLNLMEASLLSAFKAPANMAMFARAVLTVQDLMLILQIS